MFAVLLVPDNKALETFEPDLGFFFDLRHFYFAYQFFRHLFFYPYYTILSEGYKVPMKVAVPNRVVINLPFPNRLISAKNGLFLERDKFNFLFPY